MEKLFLTRELRALLKLPLGELLTGNEKETMRKLKTIVAKQEPPKVICVGDRICRNAASAGETSWIKIIDGREMRKEIGLQGLQGSKILLAVNKPGTISQMAWEAVAEAIKHKGSLLVIKGEEDLLVLPAILEAEKSSIVVYGQPPYAGISVVKVDDEKKRIVKAIIDKMGREPD